MMTSSSMFAAVGCAGNVVSEVEPGKNTTAYPGVRAGSKIANDSIEGVSVLTMWRTASIPAESLCGAQAPGPETDTVTHFVHGQTFIAWWSSDGEVDHTCTSAQAGPCVDWWRLHRRQTPSSPRVQEGPTRVVRQPTAVVTPPFLCRHARGAAVQG